MSFTVTPSAGSNGTISPSTPQTVIAGRSISFTATPAPGYEIASWQVGGTAQSAASTLTIANVISNTTVSVTFSQIPTMISGLQPYSVFASQCGSGTCSLSSAWMLAYDPYTPVAYNPNYPSLSVLAKYQNPGLVPWNDGPVFANSGGVPNQNTFYYAGQQNAPFFEALGTAAGIAWTLSPFQTPVPLLVLSNINSDPYTAILGTIFGGITPLSFASIPSVSSFTSQQQLAPGQWKIYISSAYQIGLSGLSENGLVCYAPGGAGARNPSPINDNLVSFQYPQTIQGCLQLVDGGGNVSATPVFQLSALTIRPVQNFAVQDGCGNSIGFFNDDPNYVGLPYSNGAIYVATITIPTTLGTFLKFNAIPALPDFVVQGIYQGCQPCGFLYPG